MSWYIQPDHGTDLRFLHGTGLRSVQFLTEGIFISCHLYSVSFS